jgi:ATP-dependent DNA helicase RecG
MRGPGDIEGTRQSGLAIDLKISSLSQDSQLLTLARNTAEDILERDPNLEGGDNKLLVSQLATMKKVESMVDIDYSKIS